jgi:MFS family permease
MTVEPMERCVLGIDYAIILPTAWGYISHIMHGHDPDFVMGLVLSAFALSGSVAGLIFGCLNDAGVALKRLMLVGLTFMIVGNALYFIGWNIYVIVCSRFVAGVGMGLVVRSH